MNPSLRARIDTLAAKLGTTYETPAGDAAPPPAPELEQPRAFDLPRAAQAAEEAEHVAARPSAPPRPVEGMEDFSRRLCATVREHLGPRRQNAARIYETLHFLALDVARERGYSPKSRSVSFLLPVEALAAFLGISKQTFYNRAPELRELGLLDWRAHRTWSNKHGRRKRVDTSTGEVEYLDGGLVADGVVFTVKLWPSKGGPVRVRYEWLSQQYREIDRDALEGRTAHRVAADLRRELDGLRGSTSSESEAYRQLKTLALSPLDQESPAKDRPTSGASVPADLLRALDLPGMVAEDRSRWVDSLARAMALGLGDYRGKKGEPRTLNVEVYAATLWGATWLAMQGQDYLHAVVREFQRIQYDRQNDPKGRIRNPAAVFIGSLKRAGVWDSIIRASREHGRVGVKAAAA